MTQEYKDLLLRDLCARLPYGVIGFYTAIGWKDEYSVLSANVINNIIEGLSFKPYLFPLSSMTEEQKKEWRSLMIHDSYGILYHTIKSFDYLYKNHIDIRGLIPKGLAIDCTNLNIY